MGQLKRIWDHEHYQIGRMRYQVEDIQIIELFFARNVQAIQETDAVYGGKLWAMSNRILNNRENTAECVNNTYVQAWESIPPQRPRYFYGFLASVCRHLSLSRLDWKLAAKRNAEVVALTQEMEQCISESLRDRSTGDKEIRRIIEAFLESLSVENRLLFLRRYLYVDTVTEISQRYGISERRVRKQLQKIRNKLNEHLKKEGIYI